MTSNLTGIYTIWLRDLRRFWRDKPRIIAATVQPALFLLILGTGLSRGLTTTFQTENHEGYLVFIFPGIIGMAILFTSVFSAISIVWDREIGFLKEVMVAPISRWAVAIGKSLGGGTVATLQGCLMLVFAPIIGVDMGIWTVIVLIPMMLFVAISLTSMGIVAAAYMHSMQGFTVVMNFIMLPMFFLSGAMFPIAKLPVWLDIMVKVNPMTYGVDLLRRTTISTGYFSLFTDLLVMGIFGLVMTALAVVMFTRQE